MLFIVKHIHVIDLGLTLFISLYAIVGAFFLQRRKAGLMPARMRQIAVVGFVLIISSAFMLGVTLLKG